VRYKDLTEEQVDYVIDELDLAFMKGILKEDPEYLEKLFNTTTAQVALLKWQMKQLWLAIKSLWEKK